jgi:CarD family transcriptional regulator
MEARDPVELVVGERVVYGSHGIGQVKARHAAAGDRQETISLEFAADLTVMLPMERARLTLRPLAAENELVQVEEVLRADRTVDPRTWSKRLRAMQEKVATGEILAWAEIVRDGIKGDQIRSEKGGSPPAPSERQLYLKARALLTAEVAAVRDTEPDEADAWIVGRVTGAPVPDAID